MSARQRAWPRQWLMTDERVGDRLWGAIARLPGADAGLVFRHYATPPAEREALARKIAEACRARGIMLAIAGDADIAQALGADLIHNPTAATDLPFSKSVHTLDEAREASRSGAALVFVSPVNATQSHPDRAPLGILVAMQLAQAAGVPAIALGGMSASAFAALPSGAFHGWAAIDAWVSNDGG